jgi:glutathione S-transferase
MSAPTPIAFSGSPGSPYTRKMLAILRYRRIPYRFLPSSGAALAGLPTPKVRLLPTFYLPGPSGDLEAVVDSTPIIRRLEAELPDRPLLPPDPALAFIDALIEDYADEWLTKAMFHYRWTYEPDIRKAARILPLWSNLGLDEATLASMGRMFSERQIGRLPVVGSNAMTGPIIEASYRRFLIAFEEHLTGRPYLLGARPAAGDFGVFGQLTQLAHFDPTPAALTLEIAPRVHAWVSLMEDRSGLEPADDDWISLVSPPASLMSILREIGRVYPPVMLANARALADGDAEARAQVDGQTWVQPPFPYQAKCLAWLREAHANLALEARAVVDPLLDAAGCMPMFGV